MHASYNTFGSNQGIYSFLYHCKSCLTVGAQLLEGIRAMSNAEGKKVVTCSSNYQDNVTTPLMREHANNAIDNNDSEEIIADLASYTDADAADGMLPAVKRVGVEYCFNN
jgi:hypothetical protein